MICYPCYSLIITHQNGILTQLFAVLSPLAAARSGSSSLLRVLDLSINGGSLSSIGEHRLTLLEISQLGEFETQVSVCSCMLHFCQILKKLVSLSYACT